MHIEDEAVKLMVRDPKLGKEQAVAELMRTADGARLYDRYNVASPVVD